MKRAPKILRGPLWLTNGEQGLNAEFDGYKPVARGKYELHWGTKTAEKDIFIVVGPCDFPQLVVAFCFTKSLAWFRTVETGVDLPYAGVSSTADDPKGRVHFLATIGKTMKSVEVTITGIRGLREIQIEDGFQNASARMEIRRPTGVRAPQTQRMPRALPTFKGYTIDYRLRQFRRAEVDKVLEFIDFDSPKGEAILQDMAAAETGIQPGEWGVIQPDWGYYIEVRGYLRGDWQRASAPVQVKVIQYRLDKMADNVLVEYADGKRGIADIRSLKPIHQSGGRVPQTEAICPACGGPGGSMGILGRKEWFRCRNCGMEWSRDVTVSRAPQTKGKSAKMPEDVSRHTTVSQMEVLYSTEQIKQMARRRGLSTAGSKRDVIKRILG